MNRQSFSLPLYVYICLFVFQNQCICKWKEDNRVNNDLILKLKVFFFEERVGGGSMITRVKFHWQKHHHVFTLTALYCLLCPVSSSHCCLVKPPQSSKWTHGPTAGCLFIWLQHLFPGDWHCIMHYGCWRSPQLTLLCSAVARFVTPH